MDDLATESAAKEISKIRRKRRGSSVFSAENQRFNLGYVLSCGKDSTIKLRDVGTGRLVKRHLGAVRSNLRCQIENGIKFQLDFAKVLGKQPHKEFIDHAKDGERIEFLPPTSSSGIMKRAMNEIRKKMREISVDLWDLEMLKGWKAGGRIMKNDEEVPSSMIFGLDNSGKKQDVSFRGLFMSRPCCYPPS